MCSLRTVPLLALDDRSGFRLTMTSKLRQHDAGSLLLGNIMFSLPPNTPSVGMGVSWCPSSCTSRFAHPINVFSVNVHMHQVGECPLLMPAVRGEHTCIASC